MQTLKNSITSTAIYLGEREGMLRYRAELLSKKIEDGWFKGANIRALERQHYVVLRELESVWKAQEINDRRERLELAIRQAETWYLKFKRRWHETGAASIISILLTIKRGNQRRRAEIKRLTMELCDLIIYG